VKQLGFTHLDRYFWIRTNLQQLKNGNILDRNNADDRGRGTQFKISKRFHYLSMSAFVAYKNVAAASKQQGK
jgi:hypothetical protein